MADNKPKNKSSTEKHLTSKQENFVLAVVEGMTQADAYRHAYNASNMKADTIINKASKLMARDDIRARYNELMIKVKTEIESKAICTVEGLLNDLQEIKVRCMQKEPVMEWVDGELVESGEFKFDSRGALKSIELMGRHLKMFTDKIEHSGKIDINNKSKLIDKYLEGDED